MPDTAPIVMVIDDSDETRDTLAEVICAHGYAVEAAPNGREALRRLGDRSIRPSIIVLDLMMPDMTGYAFRTAQLADESLKEIPIIIYSGVQDVADAAARMGAVAYAAKPIDVERLVALIRQHSKEPDR